MASLFAGGALAANLFKYNRKNFMFDRQMKQEREFQEQDMRVEQFGLYREDVRDLVELTVAKMDLYLIAAALLIDKTMMLIAKQNEAFPSTSPDWATALNALSLASGIFYLALALWLAMYASISAQSFGVRLLTQFVRLPYASAEQIEMASAQAAQYEAGSIDEMIRMPILQANGQGARDSDASAQAQATGVGPGGAEQDQGERLGSAAAADSPPAAQTGMPQRHVGVPGGNLQSDLLPVSAMLDHIRLYRRVQLNWQAYDAYARVSLFVGANSLLYSCLYWALGQFLQNAHADAPAIGVALIFSCLQLVLCRLDLRLRRREVLLIGVLLFTTPILTTLGMVLFMDISRGKEAGDPLPHGWKRILMEMCAFGTHLLHTLVVALILKGAWPDRVDAATEALLPGKFRSTLYLDVFGWLLNPGGPGTGETEESADERAEQSPTSTAPQSWRALAPLPGARSCWARVCCFWRRVRAPVTTPLLAAEGGEPVGDRSGAAAVRRGDVSGVGGAAAAPPPRSTTAPARQLEAESAAAGGHGAGTATWPQAATAAADRGRGRLASPPQQSAAGLFSRSSRSPSPSGSFASSRHSALELPPDRGVDLSMDIRMEAFNLLHPDGASSTGYSGRSSVGTQEVQYGGRESLPMATIERGTAPGVEATFVRPTGSGRARQRKTHPPGTTPWRAFCQGTVVILITWTSNTIWAFSRLATSKGWTAHKHHATAVAQGAQLDGGLVLGSEALAPWRRDACQAATGPLFLHQVHAGLALVTAGIGAVEQVRDGGCGFRRGFLGAGLVCPPGRNSSLGLDGCMAHWLHRGGRTVRFCRFRRHGSGWKLTLVHDARSPHRLEQLALGWSDTPGGAAVGAVTWREPLDGASGDRRPDSDAPQGSPWGGLQAVGRTRSGELLAMRVGLAPRTEACAQCSRRVSFHPEFEVALSDGLINGAERPEERERLLLLGSSLLSLRVGAAPASAAAAAAGSSSCGGESVQLRAWHLASSAFTALHLPHRSGHLAGLSQVMGRLCQVEK